MAHYLDQLSESFEYEISAICDFFFLWFAGGRMEFWNKKIWSGNKKKNSATTNKKNFIKKNDFN